MSFCRITKVVKVNSQGTKKIQVHTLCARPFYVLTSIFVLIKWAYAASLVLCFRKNHWRIASTGYVLGCWGHWLVTQHSTDATSMSCWRWCRITGDPLVLHEDGRDETDRPLQRYSCVNVFRVLATLQMWWGRGTEKGAYISEISTAT